jgi:hypothetical protein
MAKIVIFIKIDFFSYFCLVELPINRGKFLFDHLVLLLEIRKQDGPFSCFHKLNDLLRTYFCVVDAERVTHWVLHNEVENFPALDVKFFVD